MAKILFCENNLSLGAEDVLKKLEENDIKFEVEACLGYCGDCSEGPFALVDGELIQADSAEELYDLINDLL